ncbi:hypothetical protein BOTCAL_0070g00040 [Botryotinia calthae]|uniref:Zn(2)-C6 fungal-type domain-containing protein n=1 Tax=Botryotinia calthae TaxID=38488 RepID=A0A4Y8DBG8_9HELO|nr:hypothetical protein BOTCAL_0070g00040 [Botryotinia calthae]
MVEVSTKQVIKKELPKRSRAFSTRAKTGCKTCKVRHVKCDEGRPGCRKCAATGRQCDGYAHCTPSPNPKPSAISSSIVPKSSSRATHQLPTIIPDFLSPSLAVSDQEQHSFRFLHTQTAPQLSGCYGSKFWDYFVLQASHREPAVRHAAIALGSLHERFELEDRFISKVRYDTEENSFATLRGHHTSALAHIDGGVKIFSELQISGHSTPVSHELPEDYIPVSIFRMLFGRLDTQASVLTSRARIIDGESGSSPNSIPDRFLDIEQAREAMESIWTYSARNLLSCSMYNGVPLPLPTSQETKFQLLAHLENWNRAFESFSCTSTERGNVEMVSPMEIRARDHLRLHKTMTQILVTTSTTHSARFNESSELVWDDFQLEFEAMVNWASEIIRTPSDIQIGGRKAASFTLDNEILQPLFLIATKCRHRRIRNKAILLLNQADRQEGLWNSLLTAKVAERIREIEESGLGEMVAIVPESNRLRNIDMKFEFEGYNGRRAWLGYRTFSAYESGEWIQIHERNTPSETFKIPSGSGDSSFQVHGIQRIERNRESSFESAWRVSIKSESF